MEDHRVTRQVLLQCVKPAPESLFGDVPDLHVYTAINLAMNRVERKEKRPSSRMQYNTIIHNIRKNMSPNMEQIDRQKFVRH